ncbi:reverse transcriptase [Caerostris extrusa]|uniref:Reverse transcriptase n=1 Tax=Caerostris extrusa TaxID=172846 RepID=A0AAV4WUT1_CAEEX|nr:reverse transcriptase [Caerostris extrusa]
MLSLSTFESHTPYIKQAWSIHFIKRQIRTCTYRYCRTLASVRRVSLLSYMCRPFFQVARGLSTGGYISKFRCIDFLYRVSFQVGPPFRITTDQGTQFEALLFEALTKFLGTARHRTSPYHSAGNGQVEFTQTAEAAIISHSTSQCTVLPTILMGFRAAWKEDLQATTAEMLYGTPIRLPGEFFKSII